MNAGVRRFHPRHPSIETYFAGSAGRLVLEGCRLWTLAQGAGRQGLGREQSLERAWSPYGEILQEREALAARDELARFAGVLGRCAACPLRTLSPGRRNLTRDEALILGLISGIQHDDEAVTQACLDALTCKARCAEVESAAAMFAVTLRGLGQNLFHIPLHAIEDILARSGSVTLH